jgi:hypothetical protein
MIRQSSSSSRPNRLANRKASPFSKQSLTRISATVRSDKRKVAQEIQQQYTKATPKEL